MKLIRESTMDFYHLVKDETETLCGRSRPKLTEIPGLIRVGELWKAWNCNGRSWTGRREKSD